MDRSIDGSMHVSPKIKKVTVIVELEGEHATKIVEYVKPEQVTIENRLENPEVFYPKPRPLMKDDLKRRAELTIAGYEGIIYKTDPE